MTSDFSYGPVTAVDEASATGRTAEIFSDLRRTMGIPLVTSIWRGLAGLDDSLPAVWALAKPVFESGLPEEGLGRLIERTELPVPEPLAPTQLACVGGRGGGRIRWRGSEATRTSSSFKRCLRGNISREITSGLRELPPRDP